MSETKTIKRVQKADMGFMRQVIYTGGYEFATGAEYAPDMTEFPQETRRIIRHSEPNPLFGLPKAAVFNPYETQDILTDFINIDTNKEKSMLDFISRYGFPFSQEYICDSGRSFKKVQSEGGYITTYEKDDSRPPTEKGLHNGKYNVYRAIEIEELIKAIQLTRACFEISMLLSSAISDSEKVDHIKENYFLDFKGTEVGQPVSLLVSGKELGRLPAAIQYTPKTFSDIPEIDALYAYLLHVTNWKLSDYGVSMALMLVEGQLQRFNVPKNLMGAIWHMTADTVGAENKFRRCAARGCGKWFKYRNPAARVCSQACAKRLRRDELQAEMEAQP